MIFSTIVSLETPTLVITFAILLLALRPNHKRTNLESYQSQGSCKKVELTVSARFKLPVPAAIEFIIC